MSPLAGPVWAALALLVIAGAPKVVLPYDTMRALRMAGLRVHAVTVRLGGAVEAAIGLAALLTGDRLLLGLAAISYLGFAGFVAYALRRDTPLASCGCFGKVDTPPTRLHLVIVTVLAVCLGLVAITGGTGLLASARHEFAFTLVTAGFAAVICWFGYLAMTVLPKARTRPRNPADLVRIPAGAAAHKHDTTGGAR